MTSEQPKQESNKSPEQLTWEGKAQELGNEFKQASTSGNPEAIRAAGEAIAQHAENKPGQAPEPSEASTSEAGTERTASDQEMFDKITERHAKRAEALDRAEEIYTAYLDGSLDMNSVSERLDSDKVGSRRNTDEATEYNKEIYVANLVTQILADANFGLDKFDNILQEQPVALLNDYSILESGAHSYQSNIVDENGNRENPYGGNYGERVLSPESQQLLPQIQNQIDRFNSLKTRILEKRQQVRG